MHPIEIPGPRPPPTARVRRRRGRARLGRAGAALVATALPAAPGARELAPVTGARAAVDALFFEHDRIP